MTIGGIEAENDRLVQMWATRQRSYISGKPAQCGHHFYSRSNRLLRWDLRNIIPVTLEEHNKIHDGHIIYKPNPCRQEYLDRIMNISFKRYLIENRLTNEEFAKMRNKKLKEALSGKDTENI